MTDNFEDVEHQETVHPEEHQAVTARSNLAEAWRTKPIFKLLAVMTVAGALIAAASVFFSGGSKPEQMSRIVNPPDMHRAPGGSSSPYFIQQTKEAEEQRSKEALEKGTSALPTPIGQPGDINVTEKTDPMNELRSETERLKQQLADMQKVQVQRQAQLATQQAVQQQATTTAAAPPRQAVEQFDTALAQTMQNQLKQMMESWTPKGMKQVSFEKTAEGGAAAGTGKPAVGSTMVADSNGTYHRADVKPLISAGTVSYAQMLTEANSDVPTPILAQIVSGPLSGARAIGSFQVANGYNDYLVLRFSLADKKGRDYHIDAIALDPDTTLGGMATEVDQRYFTRVVMPAAAAFLQGFGQALSQTSSNVTTNGTTTIVSQSGPGIKQGIADGASSAAQTASTFFQNQANETKPLVRVAAGTPMGLFFVSSVFDPDVEQEAANGSCPPGTSPGYSVNGRVVPMPAGAVPNGCYSANGAVSSTPVSLPFGVTGLSPTGTAGAGDIPYPNYASGGVNRGYGAYGSPYTSTPSIAGQAGYGVGNGYPAYGH